jgi:hypothetical protein
MHDSSVALPPAVHDDPVVVARDPISGRRRTIAAARRFWMMLRHAVAAVFGVLAALACAPAAYADAGIGPHLGLNFDGADPVFAGVNARIDIADVGDNVELQIDPSLAYYFVESATVLHFALSLPFEFRLQDSNLRPFVGGGLSLFYVHENHNGDLRPRLNLIGGLAFALQALKPFFELRIILGHGSGFELIGGLLFNL